MNVFYVRVYVKEEISEEEINQDSILELLERSNYEIIDGNRELVSSDYSKEEGTYVFECLLNFPEKIESRSVLDFIKKKEFDIVFLEEKEEDMDEFYLYQDDFYCLAETFDSDIYTFNRLDGGKIEPEDYHRMYEMLSSLLYSKFTANSEHSFIFDPSLRVSMDKKTIIIKVDVMVKESSRKRVLK